ncbi:hypothetical protein [Fischerella sp.]|uniref:hypothetical protein n=1 Tax=Fischerella sp. TaxID=1191 RepID=UPI0025C6F879|nr:hypothetical protein [Fischerella sp.]
MHLHRYNNLHRIQQLDPLQDLCQIYHLTVGYEFPWDMVRSRLCSTDENLLCSQHLEITG